MQSRKRVCDVCPNRGKCPLETIYKASSDVEILMLCTFAKNQKWELLKKLNKLSIKTGDSVYALSIMATEMKLANKSIQTGEANKKCIDCASKRKCPFVSSNGLREFHFCPKVNWFEDTVLTSFRSSRVHSNSN